MLENSNKSIKTITNANAMKSINFIKKVEYIFCLQVMIENYILYMRVLLMLILQDFVDKLLHEVLANKLKVSYIFILTESMQK